MYIKKCTIFEGISVGVDGETNLTFLLAISIVHGYHSISTSKVGVVLQSQINQFGKSAHSIEVM